MFSKKGQSGVESQQVIFLITEILLGAVLLLGVTSFVINELSDSREQMLSKDLAFTISTLMASPAEMFYKYAPNTEEFTLDVNEEGYVRISSDSGMGKYKYIPLEGVTVQRKTISRVLSFPIKFKDNVLSFEEESAEEARNLCKLIPYSFPQMTKIKIEIYNKYASSRASLQTIKNKIETLNSLNQNSPIEFTESDDAEIKMVLSFEEADEGNVLKITYYESSNKLNYQKLSCNIASEFKEKQGQLFKSVEEIPNQVSEQLFFVLGSWKEFNSKAGSNQDIYDVYAKTIYDGILAGVKK